MKTITAAKLKKLITLYFFRNKRNKTEITLDVVHMKENYSFFNARSVSRPN